MALVTVFIVGLGMFSDLGIGPSISQSKRGDDTDFLNTAWTIQVMRGFGLWLTACALAWPVAWFYGEPALAYLLPAAAFALVIAGFEPTRIETAHRHLLVGRVTALEMLSQVIGILAMIAFAMALQSVAALVIGNLLGAAAKLVLTSRYLQGPANRFRWQRSAASELLHFGKWIFASTVFGFFSSQGDKVILGKFLTLSMLGIYNIGFFLASFPILLGYSVTGRVLIPVYRDSFADGTPEHARKLRLMRAALTGALLSLVLLLAHTGQPLVALLYDSRYVSAGAVVVFVACIQIPQIIGMSYDQAALAAGDSKGFFALSCARTVIQMTLLFLGAMHSGLIGALTGLGLSSILVYPLVARLAARHKVWDPLHDAVFAALGGSLGALALWLNWSVIVALL
jgi:O-antigen/teichoic acid export membrane protein